MKSFLIPLIVFISLMTIPLSSRVDASSDVGMGLEVSPGKILIDEPFKPGTEFPLKVFKVQNTNNDEVTVTIKTSEGIEWQGEKTFSLKPNESKSVMTVLYISKDKRKGKHTEYIEVLAKKENNPHSLLLIPEVEYQVKGSNLLFYLAISIVCAFIVLIFILYKRKKSSTLNKKVEKEVI